MVNRITKGMVMVVVIMVIAVIGAVMLFLTSASNTMMFQANDAYLKACQRNLITSGISWAKNNIQKEDRQNLNKMIELDVTDMNIIHSSLNVNISSSTDTQQEVHISTSCSRGRQILKSDDTYKIE